jgi:rhamnose utilization protein RhaD (predicted bifunctional aldolase and dehydrogenase)
MRKYGLFFSNLSNINAMKKIDQLVVISRFYGKDHRFVIAGGGNTSYKNEQQIWVKASGFALATIDEEGFALLDRAKLQIISGKSYSSDADLREAQVKSDLEAACITKNRRPSVETSMHNAINYAFVVHLHPTAVNGLMCSQQAESKLRELFGDQPLYIPYTDPGYVLFKKVEGAIAAYRAERGKEPSVIWLQNHGIFVAANDIEEIRRTYDQILDVLDKEVQTAASEAAANSPALQAYLQAEDSPVPERVTEVIPALRMLASEVGQAGQSRFQPKTLKIRNNKLIEHYCKNTDNYISISRPLRPMPLYIVNPTNYSSIRPKPTKHWMMPKIFCPFSGNISAISPK